jgi:hypothetical protein
VTETHTFGLDDQHLFAEVSADHNPIHVNPAQSRRLIGGACLVHGVHGLLWALNTLKDTHAILPSVRSMTVRFQKWIAIGTPVTAQIKSQSTKQWKLEIVSADGLHTSITLKLGTQPKPPKVKAFTSSNNLGKLSVAIDRNFENLVDVEGLLSVDSEIVAGCEKLFPDLCHILRADVVAAMALTSTIVGMHAPGLHSLFSELSFDLNEVLNQSDSLSFSVVDLDERYRLAIVNFSSAAFTGSLSAFVRFPPVNPPSAKDISTRVPPKFFAGRSALVVGGSRGIGAVTAKIFAAGGGKVTVTYAEGANQAKAVVDDINATFGAGSARAMQLDVTQDGPLLPQNVGIQHDTLFYFATPAISGTSRRFSASLFDKFKQFYVERFAAILDEFVTAVGETNEGYVFYPSTVYIEERPKGMTEYAMAKVAGEVMCVDFARGLPKWVFQVARLPRVATDQTMTVPPIKSEDPLDVMLNILGVP